MQEQEQRPQEKPFNARDHVMQLKSSQGPKDYLPVQYRLVWFREQCPQGTIETEMLHLDLDRETEEEAFQWNNEKRRSEKIIKKANGIAVFRAVVKDGKGGIATGTKSEKAASFPDFLEKAETGAIGRALAALGYGTQFAPELNEEHRIVDSPVEQSSSGDLTAMKADWIQAYTIKPQDTEKRWTGFKMHVLEVAVEDSDLTVEQIKRLAKTIETQKRSKSQHVQKSA